MQRVIACLRRYRFASVSFVLVSFVLALGCTWISWHLVEKRALQITGWGRVAVCVFGLTGRERHTCSGK